MTAASLLNSLRKKGIEVQLDGRDLRVTSAEHICPGTLDQVKQLKSEIIAHIAAGDGKSKRDRTIDTEQLEAMESLLQALGAEVETPVGRGRLVYLTPHGAVVQVASGLMYTLDPRRVKK
ncbi:MAG: hypothetical protein H0W86_09180 [Armatimonadetes bacterium]|nr:hypothetical protein [Armatimonadota bacterium]